MTEAESDIFLWANWNKISAKEIADTLSWDCARVYKRCDKLGIERRRHLGRQVPSAEEWIEIASQEARKAGLKPQDVLSGSRTGAAIVARWRAWQRLKEANPKYSLNAIAAVSGFDHTSLVNAFSRIRHGTNRPSRVSVAFWQSTSCLPPHPGVET